MRTRATNDRKLPTAASHFLRRGPDALRAGPDVLRADIRCARVPGARPCPTRAGLDRGGRSVRTRRANRFHPRNPARNRVRRDIQSTPARASSLAARRIGHPRGSSSHPPRNSHHLDKAFARNIQEVAVGHNHTLDHTHQSRCQRKSESRQTACRSRGRVALAVPFSWSFSLLPVERNPGAKRIRPLRAMHAYPREFGALANAYTGSFIAQRPHGLNSHRAPRWRE